MNNECELLFPSECCYCCCCDWIKLPFRIIIIGYPFYHRYHHAKCRFFYVQTNRVISAYIATGKEMFTFIWYAQPMPSRKK